MIYTVLTKQGFSVDFQIINDIKDNCFIAVELKSGAPTGSEWSLDELVRMANVPITQPMVYYRCNEDTFMNLMELIRDIEQFTGYRVK